PDLVDPPSILRPICSTETRPIETYTLSLHDALPISAGTSARLLVPEAAIERIIEAGTLPIRAKALGEDARRACRSDPDPVPGTRSEEHTSELQSRENLVCRLLLEKKNTEKDDATRTQ